MKTIAIHQPYFFPYIGYWQLIHAVDRFVICDDVNYIKNGWINRNRLLINNEPAYLTVPLHQGSQNKKICELDLQSQPDPRDKLAHRIAAAYRKAPHFAEAYPVIESVIRHEANNLSDYLAHQLQTLSRFMGIATEIGVTSRIYGNNELRGQDRVIDMCKCEGATTYVNAQGGQALYDTDAFLEAGIDLRFLIPRPLNYRQWDAEFIPNLSIIDVLMFNSKEKILAEFLGSFDLINTGALPGVANT